MATGPAHAGTDDHVRHADVEVPLGRLYCVEPQVEVGDEPPPRAAGVTRIGQARAADDVVAMPLQEFRLTAERAGTAAVEVEDAGHPHVLTSLSEMRHLAHWHSCCRSILVHHLEPSHLDSGCRGQDWGNAPARPLRSL